MTHRNEVTTAVKRILNRTDCDGRERKKILKEDLEKGSVVPLQELLQKQENDCRLSTLLQRYWMTASNSVSVRTDAKVAGEGDGTLTTVE